MDRGGLGGVVLTVEVVEGEGEEERGGRGEKDEWDIMCIGRVLVVIRWCISGAHPVYNLLTPRPTSILAQVGQRVGKGWAKGGQAVAARFSPLEIRSEEKERKESQKFEKKDGSPNRRREPLESRLSKCASYERCRRQTQR